MSSLTLRLCMVALLAVVTIPLPAQSATQKAAFQALLDRQMLSWQKADFSIAAGDWEADGVLTSPGGRLNKTDIQASMTDYAKHFKDLNVVVKHVILSANGREAAVEWDWSVTRIRDGAHSISHDCIVVELQGHKIKSWREYFDFGGSIEANP